jgi:hypothetical protein
MDALTIFGLVAVTAMLMFYALEDHSRWFILAFAGACVLASAYGFMQGAWPFGIIEAHDPISTALSGSSSPRVARLVAPNRAAIDLSVRGPLR